MKNNFMQEIEEIFQTISKPWVQILIIVSVISLVYLNAFPNQFVLDDDTFIRWPLIKDFKYIPAFFTGILPQEHIGDYRPLKGVILVFNPPGFLALNILLRNIRQIG